MNSTAVSQLSKEQERRVIESIAQTQRFIDKEMAYSPEFRNSAYIAGLERHMEKLVKMLGA